MENEILDDNSLNDQPIESTDLEYGGFRIRTGAAILDALVLFPLSYLVFYNTATIKSFTLAFIISTLSFLYKPLMEGIKGATLGKMACNLKIVDVEDLGQISMTTSFTRNLPWFVFYVIGQITSWETFSHPNFAEVDNFLEIGVLAQDSSASAIQSIFSFIFLIIVFIVAIDSKKQGLHDKWSKVYVIKNHQ